MKEKILNKIMETSEKEISVYVHIPFCESRCFYCDFYSSVINENTVSKYFKYLNYEIEMYRDFLKDKTGVSIFFGGGTPSSVKPEYITETLKHIKSMLKLSENCEITIECNPNSVTEEKILKYTEAGFNRFSIGVQSFSDKILKSIGRIHTRNDILKAVGILRKYGVENFSFDLMLALPYQKFEDILDSIHMAEFLNPTHISCYSLIVEENTPMAKIYAGSPFLFPSEDEDRKMYRYAVKELEKLGYMQYEISNFAKEGFSSVHNTRYWKLENYLGFGVSSHSNIDNIRFFSYSDFIKYFRALENRSLPVEDCEVLEVRDRINEFAIMGLRMNEGINTETADKRFGIDFKKYYKNEIEKNLKKGLIEIKDGRIVLTELGRDLSNIVEVDFIKLDK